MEPYVAFSDNAILEGATPQEGPLEGQTQATIPVKILLDPAKELDPAKVPTEKAAPIEESTEEAPPTGAH